MISSICRDAEPGAAPGVAPRWEHFAHGADIGVRGIGATPAQAFAQAARALTAVICDPDLVAPREAVTIDCEQADLELLLADWLNAVIYEMAVRGLLFGDYEVRIEDGRLHATARGEPLDRGRHEPAVEVKGATYTELEVAPLPEGGWRAQCVVDV